MPSTKPPVRVGLFVTCLVDLLRPTVGFAAVHLLERAGCTVEVPRAQTCCGQPAYNSGDQSNAKALAQQVIAAFADYDTVVAPSGSCVGTLRAYPALLADDPVWAGRAASFAQRCYELTEFLVDVLGVTAVEARHDGRVTYHDSCSSLRGCRIHDQPRRLLASVSGLTLQELADGEICCGFGGSFSVKHPAISGEIVDAKAAAVAATGAATLLAGDLGCLINIAGRLKRRGDPVAVRHVAEVLAGMCDAAPGIGDALDH